MKKISLVLLSISLLIFSIGCEGSKTEVPEFSESEEFPEMIEIEGELWVNTDEEVIVEINEDEIIGKIESSVDRYEWPSENNQANFEIEGSSYAYYEDNMVLKIKDKWILFLSLEDWEENNDIKVSGGAISVGYDMSYEEEIFGDLNQEEISKITDEIMNKVAEDDNYEENGDSIIEKVFKDNGITDPDRINAAKSKMIISKGR